MPVRALLALLTGLLLLTLGACGQRDIPDAALGIDELLERGQDSIGEEVRATGAVAEVISDHLVRVGQRGAGEGNGLLVVSTEALDVETAELVRVEGTIRDWDIQDVGVYLNENVNLELYQHLDDEELVLELDTITSLDQP